MPRARAICGAALLLVWLTPGVAAAQQTAKVDAQPSQREAAPSRLWLVAGGAFATVRGDCQTCEDDFPYRHSGSILADLGYQVSERMDVGAELSWVPINTADGRIRTTHVDAVAQFRPWTSQGFFLKGGAGMAFVRNWVDAVGSDAINSKALSLVIGGGWIVHPAARLGLQIFAAQHAAALGDLTTATVDVPDVMGNFWSVGMAIVIH